MAISAGSVKALQPSTGSGGPPEQRRIGALDRRAGPHVGDRGHSGRLGGVLAVAPVRDADAALSFVDKAALADYLAGADIADLVAAGRLTVTGDDAAAGRFAGFFDEPASMGRILVTLHCPTTSVPATSA